MMKREVSSIQFDIFDNIILTYLEHQEFLKKRKEHYKNELNAAKLLMKQSQDEDDDEEDQ